MIRIAHLYYDLLNLYGENGNVKALTKLLDDLKMQYQLDKLSLNDNFELNNYDFIYIGTGTEGNQKIALNHFIKYKDDVKSYIESNKIMLVTGNSIELFGNYITDLNGIKHDGLALFDYYSSEVDYRIANEVLAKCNLVVDDLLGFINQNSITYNNSNFFSEYADKKDGYCYKNFYGTNIIGPILVRNPLLLIYFIEKLLNTKISDYNLKLEYDAYQTYLQKYNKNKKA
jgi:lipid II isoglutaminyl synthase (glutamine-hydrolysing)